jgi:hypothetical protein
MRRDPNDPYASCNETDFDIMGRHKVVHDDRNAEEK